MRIDYDNRIITFRQSGLEEYFLCPDRARRKWFEDLDDPTTDAAAIGTACHSSIEYGLWNLREGGMRVLVGDLIALAKIKFDEIIDTEGIKYVKGTYEDAMQFIETAIPAWRSYIEPYVCVDKDLLLEWNFDVPLMYWVQKYPDAEGNEVEWNIRLTGTSDCVDRFRIYDWKTAGQAYKQHEKQRWGAQATVYSYAAVESGLFQWPVDFTFAVIKKMKTKEYAELIPVRRTEAHVDWLRQQISGLLTLWDSVGEEGPWPLVDTHFLCSEKFCPAWSTCKGSLLSNQDFMWKP